ncbi:iron ABC transporter substrate-binding protein [Rhodospirillum rubrum]|uniref:iron ABC transporter substrate-binding protein n=1 Tax=Rhodospirillum rubrum TaxID=1085 RepID=UPI0019061EAB|nr:iron ABC transporter substrate-binding protein [Rhodospirillum rubrum]MBK1663407.1 iron ABC transporter substrate-binding protein [Rhodospirillum rubrum]MBK1675410.1 iron ABC transporter substrate-binding protein [Rhodospirillum rubrum]
MDTPSRRDVLAGLGLGGIASALIRAGWTRPARAAEGRLFRDDADRSLSLPASLGSVLPAGPVAAVWLYTLAPDLMAGWPNTLSADQRALIAPPYADLPVRGRVALRGGTVNLEALASLRPDLILDVGSLDPSYRSVAERVQGQTGIAYALIDGGLDRVSQTYARLGDLLGRPQRAAELAAWASAERAEITRRLPPADRPAIAVYYGRGAKGMESAASGAITTEVIDLLGARNVVAANGRGLVTISPESLVVARPEVILATDQSFLDALRREPRWQSLPAVRAGRLYKVPALPFGWVDYPPAINRLLGLRWLAKLLYPQAFPEPLAPVVRDFFARFYQITLSLPQAAALAGEDR